MNLLARWRVIFTLFVFLLVGWMPSGGHAETFVDSYQSGVIELKDFRYPVFMFLPDEMEDGRAYPLVISVPDEGEDPDDNIEQWKSVAKRMSVLVLVPTYKRLDDLPHKFDEWFFRVKSVTSAMYPVNLNKIYLVGNKGGGAYASYLAVNYPEEFSAVAILEGKLGGHFGKMMEYSGSKGRQIPFYVALKQGQDDVLADIEEKAYQFQAHGYPIEVKQFPAETDFTKRDFKKELILWLDQKSEQWNVVKQESKQTIKARLKQGIKDFFTV